MGLRELVGDGPVALDTAIFIYFLEQHPTFAGKVRPVFAAADSGALQIITSALTLLETLVVPLRAGDVEIAEAYETILTTSRGLRVIDLDRAQLRIAAQLRASYNLCTPDALQIAAALSSGCTAFVTNDRRLPDIAGLRIVQLREI